MARQKAQSGRSGGGLLLLILLLPVGAVFLPTTVLAALGMIPTAVAWFIDRDPEKSAPITVGSLNLCGVLPFLLDLWQSGHTMGFAMAQMSRPITWLTMYSAAGIGWVLYFVLPSLVATVVVMRKEAQITDMEEKRRALIDAWGPEVNGKTSAADKPSPGDEG